MNKLNQYNKSPNYVEYLKQDIDYVKSAIKQVEFKNKNTVNCTHLVEMYMIEDQLKKLKSHLARQEKILAKLI